MDIKKADNSVITTKQNIEQIDDKINIEKERIRKLENIHEELISLNRNMDKCIEILSKSMKGPTSNVMFDDMHNSNRIFLLKTASNLTEQAELSRKNINKLYQEKDEIINTNKEE